jgi:hypothetical protein
MRKDILPLLWFAPLTPDSTILCRTTQVQDPKGKKIPEPSLGSVRKPLRNGILLFGRFVLVNCQVIWCYVAPNVARPLFLVVVQIALKWLDS